MIGTIRAAVGATPLGRSGDGGRDLARPSPVLPPPGATANRPKAAVWRFLAAPNFRADGIRGRHRAAYSDLEVSRLSSVKYDVSEENARTMILLQTCIRCRRAQRLPSYAAGYAGLSNSSWADRVKEETNFP